MSIIERVEVDGRAADARVLGRLLPVAGYGHFTAMQVRAGRVRGLALHVARLQAASVELFGAGLDGDLVRGYVRHALDGVGDASVRVYVWWPSVVVTVRPPVEAPVRPQRLLPVPFQRPLAHVKHTGSFGQAYYRRVAERDGFDDALLTGPGGVVSEAAIANVACFDGSAVVWPDAPHLAGVTMGLLEPLLPSRRGPVLVADLPSFRAVLVTNSHGVAAVGQVGEVALPVDEVFVAMVARRYAAVPWDTI
jgi:branched-subunit amino acid aminotransferase/4-amino-4-deoxychorismate lyase